MNSKLISGSAYPLIQTAVRAKYKFEKALCQELFNIG